MVIKNAFYLSVVFFFVLSFLSCQKENQPPVADFTFTPAAGTMDTVFTFDASDSYDDEDETSMLQVHWDWTNDGAWDTDFSSNKVITHKFTGPGEFTVVLEAKDTKGLVNSTSKKITVIDGNAGILSDSRDGQEYRWVKIGTQIWMAENLAYLPSVNPPTASSYTDSYYYVYGYDGTNVSEAKSNINYLTYGALYNWPAAMNGASGSVDIPSGVQGICPAGWHLPSAGEWGGLIDYLTNNGYGYGGTGNDIAKSMASTSGWKPSAEAGEVGNDQTSNNQSGFNGLPAGYRINTLGFVSLSEYAFFWSATEGSVNYAQYWYLSFKENALLNNNYYKNFGFSVRCLRN